MQMSQNSSCGADKQQETAKCLCPGFSCRWHTWPARSSSQWFSRDRETRLRTNSRETWSNSTKSWCSTLRLSMRSIKNICIQGHKRLFKAENLSWRELIKEWRVVEPFLLVTCKACKTEKYSILSGLMIVSDRLMIFSLCVKQGLKFLYCTISLSDVVPLEGRTLLPWLVHALVATSSSIRRVPQKIL